VERRSLAEARECLMERVDLLQGTAAPHARHESDAGRADARLAVCSSLESADPLRPRWDALLQEYPCTTPFCTWEWLAPWWRAYARDDRLRILVMGDGTAAPAGLAPLALSSRAMGGLPLRVLRMVGDGSHDSDNLDLPVRPGHEAEFSRALLDWMQQHAREWDVGQLYRLPDHSPMANRLEEDFAARGWKSRVWREGHCVIELPATWEAYLKMLSSKERGKVGIRARRLERKYQVRLRAIADEAEVPRALAALFDLHTRHWAERGLPGSFQSPSRRGFYRDLAPLLLARNRLELWVLELNDRIAAVQFALRHGDTVYALQEGYDPALAADSVGYVLRAGMLKALIGAGTRRYDFLGGVTESKVRWGAVIQDYLNIDFARPRTVGAAVLAARHQTVLAKNWLREHLPERAWLAINRWRFKRLASD
jgi:CelD/BcsL family acetyltransferase involved in cellulose biosynthesis